MSAEKKALNDRGVREAYLGTTQKELVQYCGQTNPGNRRVQKLLNSLNTAEESQKYMEEQQAIYFAGKTVAEDKLEGDEIEVDEGSIKKQRGLDSKRKISVMEVEINETIKSLTEVLGAASITSDGYKEAWAMLTAVEQKLKVEYKTLAGTLGDNLEAAEANTEKEKSVKFLTEKIALLGSLRTKVMMKSPIKDESTKVTSGTGVKVERSEKRTIKTAPIPVPKWDGKTRSFPRFKKLWEENIIPFHEDSALHMMLVQSLPKEMLEEVSSLASSFQEIWEHLEEKAGKVEVIARDIMADLLALSHRKVGKKFIAKFSVILEDSEALLSSIGQQAWLTSPRSVADLEDLLPVSEKMEWAKKVKGSVGADRFEKFKMFLKGRKEELEALETIGNKGVQILENVGVPTCTYCHKRGHTEMEGGEIICRAKKADQARGGGGGTRAGADRGNFGYRDGCAICGSRDHWKNECPDKGTDKDRFSNRGRDGGQARGRGGAQADGVVHSNQLRRSECNRCKYAAKNISSCIGCKKSNNIDHCLLHCGQYICLGVEDRVKLVRGANGCAVCLNAGHQAASCNYKDKNNWICGIDGCNSHHHPTLHGSRDMFVKINTLVVGESRFQDVTDWKEREGYQHDSYQVVDEALEKASPDRQIELKEVREELQRPGLNGDQVLLVVQDVGMVYGPERQVAQIVTFFDDGSTCSVVLNSVAKQYGLLGEKVTVTIETLNAVTTKETMLYMVELFDKDGVRRLVRAFGFDNISEPMGSIELEGVKSMFSAEMQERWMDWGVRPSGAVQLLVGSEVAHLHPKSKETVENLVIKTSIFGTGLVLNGGHPSIKTEKVKFDSTVGAIRQGNFVKVNKVTVKYTQDRDFKPMEYDQGCSVLHEKDFLAAEGLGVEAPKRCRSCIGCKECSFRGRQMSQREAAEYKLIEEGIVFDEKVGRFRVTYPFIDDPRKLSNNYGQVVRIAESEEKKLAKENLTEVANKLFDKIIDVGAIGELTKAEMDMWEGPVHYNSIQHVIDPGSATTPLRLVTNSSLADPATGISLNSILAKGPMVLNDMFEILIRFRVYERGLISDVSKAYFMLLTGEVEKHVRRIVWRYGKTGTKWRIFAFLTVGMGDRPAACLMEIAVKMTVLIFGHIDLVAAWRLNRDRFVDDIATGGTQAEVERFKGVENVETMTCDGTVSQIMGKTNLNLKAVAISGEIDGEKLKKLGASVLGMGFSTERDTMFVKFRANTSVKKRGAHTGPDWTIDSIGGLEDTVLTMRLCMGVANCQYDPMGVGCPIVIQLKVGIREMYKQKLTYDEALPANLQRLYKDLIRVVVDTGNLEFRRCTRPKNAVGKCVMISYFDGSDEAFSAVIYLRWKLSEGGYEACLLVAKAKVSDMWGKSTVRVEMNGAVCVMRLTYRAIKSLNPEDLPERVWVVGDSETVLASREKDSGFFGEYFGNRIGETYDFQDEIQKIVPVGYNGEWWHVRSAGNAADRASRLGSVPSDLKLGSEWQTGPDYLCLDREEWPFERNFADRKTKVHIPEEEIVKKYRGIADSCGYVSLHDLVDHRRGEGQLTQLGILVKNQMDELADKEVGEQMNRVNKKAMAGEGGPGSRDNDVLKYFQFGYITNDWDRLLRKTAILFQWRAKVLSKKGIVVASKDMAEMFWMRVAMPATNKAGSQGKLKHLTPKKHDKYDDLIVVTGRAAEGLKHYLQKDFLPVIMSSTRTATLVTLWAHDRDHSGVDVTFMTATQVAWIVGGRALARCVKQSCVRCRYLGKLLEGQQMAVLPARLTVPCPVFSHIGVDLAGPFSVKKEGSRVTRRNTGTFKIWVVLFVCLSTKALKLYVAGGYSTGDFLLAWDSFVADHGDPLTCHSDRGSQLVAAAKQNPDLETPDYDWDLVASSLNVKTAWYFTPAQAQFRNGAVEIFVKKFKRTLQHKFQNRRMGLLEMETALKIVASVANSRPLSARYGPKGGLDPDYLTPLTPNMMLTGRSNSEIPIRNYDRSENLLVRLEYVQRVVSEWWEQFKIQNFSSLVPTQRWQLERRNMKVGDIVLVQYESKSSPGTYRLARVIKVEVDKMDGLVHTCVVMYSLLAELKPADRGKYKGITRKELRVPVQRLVLILPVEEAEVRTEIAAADKVPDESEDDDQVQDPVDGHVQGPVDGQAQDRTADEEGVVSGEEKPSAVFSGYEWGELGPSFEVDGEAEFFAVKRKECKVFDLVNLDWYRSSHNASSDPSSSCVDLWHYFKCGYSNQTWFDSDVGQAAIDSEE